MNRKYLGLHSVCQAAGNSLVELNSSSNERVEVNGSNDLTDNRKAALSRGVQVELGNQHLEAREEGNDDGSSRDVLAVC